MARPALVPPLASNKRHLQSPGVKNFPGNRPVLREESRFILRPERNCDGLDIEMRQMERGGAGIAQHQMLADRRMTFIDAIDDRHFKGEGLMTQVDGKRLSVGQRGLAAVHQVEARIVARADLSVAQEGELLGQVRADLSGEDEVHMRGQVGQLLGEQSRPGMERHGPCDEAVADSPGCDGAPGAGMIPAVRCPAECPGPAGATRRHQQTVPDQSSSTY